MSIRIVETVTGDTTGELRQRRDVAAARADIVEIRIDGVAGLDLAAVLADRVAPVVVTCRPVWEGGRFDGTEPDRLRLLRRARALGAEFIDVEFRADWRSVAPFDPGDGGRRAPAEGLVLSFHDFTGVPQDLETIAEGMQTAGADVVKIAVTPGRLSDCVRLARTGRSLRNAAMIGMGPHGFVTRVMPARFGSSWTYAGELSGLGQVSTADMRDVYGAGLLTRVAALYGVTGRPVMHSRSPELHNAAFRHEQLDALYAPLEAVDFADFLAFAEAFDVRGASVTAPFKADALAAAASADGAATQAAAANTLKRAKVGWRAANTDIAGFLEPLSGIDLRGMNAAVIGRGGGARAVEVALISAGARVTAIGRADLDRASEPWDLLVHATPVGTAPADEVSIMAGRPVRARRVYDLVYNPLETQLMRDAAAAGADTIGGMRMLTAQAARQFEFWFDRPAPSGVYEAAARRVQAYETDDIRRVR
ncbi:MAG: type I 3-dehydroquinate dehydratase [Acidobacteriota bacterium]|nr:type I 3-dehydroquinate dehydratase [Acidobacteriota bacterium]